MKLITYKCQCGYQSQLVDDSYAFDKKCQGCGEDVRSYRIVRNPKPRPEKNHCYVDAMMLENERWSWSMACNPDEIPRMMQAHPGSVYNDEGQLLIRNRHHKLKEMKRRGYTECDGYRNRQGVRGRR